MPNTLLTEVHHYLKDKGYRRTKLRNVLLETLEREDEPIAVPKLLEKLAKLGYQPNKTTVYRELEMLTQESIVDELDLLEGKKRYELRVSESHPHLVCSQCGDIQCVKLNSTIETWLERFCEQYSFKMQKNVLEFFGLCRKCQT